MHRPPAVDSTSRPAAASSPVAGRPVVGRSLPRPPTHRTFSRPNRPVLATTTTPIRSGTPEQAPRSGGRFRLPPSNSPLLQSRASARNSPTPARLTMTGSFDQPKEVEEQHPAVAAVQQPPAVATVTPPLGGGALKLPTGWTEHTEPASGRPYYYHAGLALTQWVPPVDPLLNTSERSISYSETPSTANSPTARSSVAVVEPRTEEPVVEATTATETEEEPLPSGWEERVDQSSGRSYYIDTIHQVSVWERPTDPVVLTKTVEDEVEEYPPQDMSVSMEDQTSEAVENPVAIDPPILELQESQSEKMIRADLSQTSIANGVPPVSSLPPGWVEVTDESSGRIYYFNEREGLTQWERPDAIPAVFSQEEDIDVNEPVEETAVVADPTEEEPVSDADDASLMDADIPAGWTKMLDPNTDQAYYVHDDGMTTWELPPSTQDGAGAFEASEEEPASLEVPVVVQDTSESEKNVSEPVEDSPSINLPSSEDTLPPGWTVVTDPSTGADFYFHAEENRSSWERPTVELVSVEDDVPPPAAFEAIAETAMTPEDHSSQPKPTIATLPAGWDELVDEASGRPYYYNAESDLTSWDPPTDTTIGESPAALPELVTEYDAIDVATANPSAHEESVEDAVIHGGEEEAVKADSTPMDETSDLLPGWVAAVDQSSGKVYYFNEVDNITSWDKPGISSTILTQPSFKEPCQSASLSEPAVPESIVEAEEEELVGGTTSTSETDLNSNLPSGWEEVLDTSSGKPYYVNEALNITSWDRPLTPVELSKEPHVGGQRPETASPLDEIAPTTTAAVDTENEDEGGQSGPVLPPGWTEVEDTASGQVYFYNEIDGTTSWEWPQHETDEAAHPPSSETGTGEEEDDGVLVDDANGPTQEEETPNSQPIASEVPLPPGWEKVVDPGSGSVYYLNLEQNLTSWNAPTDDDPGLVQSESLASNDRQPDGWVEVSDPSREVASSMPLTNEVAAKEEKTSSLLDMEAAKVKAGVHGPFNTADDSAVFAYVKDKARGGVDLLWSLIAIAAKSHGKLRSDRGLGDPTSPETAVVALLLQDEQTPSQEGGNSSLTRAKEPTTSMISVQELLVRGEREAAADAAVTSGDFAMALLIAGMCSRKTYQRVARQYADSVLLDRSPLHTVALLFSGQLHAPSKDGLEKSKSSFWGGDMAELKRTWKSHLAAIISNRTNGWDVIVAALGDSLRDIGEIVAAHFCYMVCGCPVGSPARPDCRLTLIGLSLTPADVTLETRASIEAFERTEAYEWAKRRGNVNAAIQSLQPFKLTYAIQLAKNGLGSTARQYSESIEKCMAITREELARAPAFTAPLEVAVVSPKRDVIVSALRDLKSLFEPQTSVDQLMTIPDIVAGEGDPDVSFLTAQSNLTEAAPQHRTASAASHQPKVDEQRGHRPVPTQRHGKKQVASDVNVAPSLGAITEESHGISPHPFPGGQSLKPEAQGYPAATPPMDVGLSATSTGSPTFVSSQPPQTSERSGMLDTGQPPGVFLAQNETGPSKPPGAYPRSDPMIAAAKPPPMTASTPVRSASRREKAPVSAPAQLEQMQKSTPSSTAKKKGLLGGFRSRMTKWLNPDATEADLGDGMQAYYDEKLKVWVFPGEDPAEVAKPVGPPPTTPMAQPRPAAATSPSGPPSADPLAAMMAPPTRGPAALRARSSVPSAATPRAFPPGIPGMGPPGASPPGAAPPTFAVFQPKPASNPPDEK